jgi:hypothetical protein
MAAKVVSLENCLEKHIPPEELKEVKRILFGKPARLDSMVFLCFANSSHV